MGLMEEEKRRSLGMSQVPDIENFKASNEKLREVAEKQKKEQAKYSLTPSEMNSIVDVREIPGGKALIKYVKCELRKYTRAMYNCDPEKVSAMAGLQGKAHTYEEILDLLTMEVDESA